MADSQPLITLPWLCITIKIKFNIWFLKKQHRNFILPLPEVQFGSFCRSSKENASTPEINTQLKLWSCWMLKHYLLFSSYVIPEVSWLCWLRITCFFVRAHLYGSCSCRWETWLMPLGRAGSFSLCTYEQPSGCSHPVSGKPGITPV